MKKRPLKFLFKKSKLFLPNFFKINPFIYQLKKINIDKILLGGEGDLSGWNYALRSNDLARPSTLISDGPHSKLIKHYKNEGIQILHPQFYSKTDYFKNVEKCIDVFGEYFPGMTKASQSVKLAKHFIDNYDQCSDPSFRQAPIKVRRVKETDFFQVIQGNHRSAICFASGGTHIFALVHRWKLEVTPVQFLLELLGWEKGEKVLYQPLPFIELSNTWILARNCQDRFEMMVNFLNSKNISNGKFLDIGSYYGWFLTKFDKLGFTVKGIERDFIAYKIGCVADVTLEAKIEVMDFIKYLSQSNEEYDIISCLSVLHHQINGREAGDAVNSIRLIDQHTKKVLFFEMGEESENWFRKSLNGWNPESIAKWVLENTSFTKSYALGTDSDGINKFNGNFGRTLFAFTRE